MCYVYFITDDHGHIKIGKAVNVFVRKQELQTGNPYKLRILLTIQLMNEKDAFELESALHRHFKKSQMEGEWFEEGSVLHMLEQNIIKIGRFSFRGRGIPLQRYSL